MKKRRKLAVFCMAVLFVVITGLLFCCDRQTVRTEEWVMTTDTDFTKENGSVSETDGDAEITEADEPAWIYVYVCGCVNKPDVYQMEQGMRLYEAIQAAGGAGENADLASLNLADVLYDGEKVYVPSEGEEGISVQDTEDEKDGRLNINTATAAELKTLPGIGEAKANAILNYRETHGSFSSIEDVLLVPGIKEGIYGQIQSLIRVN
jgi:competence protein ComEA